MGLREFFKPRQDKFLQSLITQAVLVSSHGGVPTTVQAPVPFTTEHARPHLPQLLASEHRSTSSSTEPSQSSSSSSHISSVTWPCGFSQ